VTKKSGGQVLVTGHYRGALEVARHARAESARFLKQVKFTPEMLGKWILQIAPVATQIPPSVAASNSPTAEHT